jgi:hypothetical protein
MVGRRVLFVVGVLVVGLLATGAQPAYAFEFTKALSTGDVSPEVRVLENRLAGWFPKTDQTVFEIDDRYDGQTRWAVTRFQKHYGLAADGVAGPQVFKVLDRLEDADGSTAHFDYSEFWQKRNSGCSRKANSHAGTFGGGMLSARKVKRNVTRLMWRLEAVRAKGGDNPIGINSGFRSVAYNQCIGGAGLSQHMYGTAADTKMAGVTNRKQRDIARGSQTYGIGCYSSLSHNHLDLRLQTHVLAAVQSWWWPRQDEWKRDLADDGRPCLGEKKRTVAKASSGAVLTEAELETWEAAGEVPLNGAD